MRDERYSNAQAAHWNDFLRGSKNGTFLYERGYMDYHRDRFSDHSLMIYDDADHLVALLPANLKDTMLVSHGGLTYGGFVTDAQMKTPLMLHAFDAALTFCRERGITGLRYKAMPHIYQQIPAQADLYALFLCGAHVADRSVMTVIPARDRIPLPKGRRYSVAKARKHGLSVCRDDDFAAYWALLEQTLGERHGAHPVHSLAEIDLLHRRFPDNIQLYTCRDRADLIAGVLIFESARVARTQYIAANARGRECSALDLIFDHLLNVVFPDKPYFDFGTSHEPLTGAINEGLIDHKESFGGRAVAQDTYWLDLAGWNPEPIRQALT